MNIPETNPNHRDLDSFDIRRTWTGLKQACTGHKLLILITIVATVGVVIAYMYFWPPIFIAKVTVVADAADDRTRESFYQYWNVFRSDHLPDEAILLTAAPIAEQVVDELGLTYDEVYHSFMSHAVYLWTESWVGKNYRKVKEMIFPKQKTPYDPTPEEIDRARTIHDFKTGIALTTLPETNIGVLVVKGPSPRVAQVANAMVETYLEERQLRHIEEAELAYNSILPEAKKAEEELHRLETNLEDYYTENGILLTFERDKVELSQWLEMRGAITEVETQIATLKSTLVEITDQLAREDREITSVHIAQRNTLRENLVDRLSQYEIALEQMQQRFREESPEIQELKIQIGAVEAMIAGEEEMLESQTTRVLSTAYETLRQRKSQIEAELEGAEAGLAVRRKAAETLGMRVSLIPEKMKRANELGRSYGIYEKTFTVLQDKLMMAAASMATARSAPPSMRVIEYAVAPEKAWWPKKKYLLLGAGLVGLLAGIGLALLVDLLYARVNIHLKAQGEFPIYAVLDQDKGFAKRLFALSKI